MVEKGGGTTGGTPRGPAGSPRGEFNVSDPVNCFIKTAINVVTGPARFYRGIIRQGDIRNPLVFAIVCYALFTIIAGIVGIITGAIFATASTQDAGQAAGGFLSGIGGLLVLLILSPLRAVVVVAVLSLVFHLLVALIVGARNSGFEATFRVVAYASVSNLIVGWIPLVGWILGPIYSAILVALGIREVHATTTQRAALIALIPLGVGLLLAIAIVLVVGGTLLDIMSSGEI